MKYLEVHELEKLHEYIALSKVVFLGNFLKKFQSPFIYVFKVGARCFNKISVKLLNHFVGPSGVPGFGLSFKSLGK